MRRRVPLISMRVKRLLEQLENTDPEALVIVVYPEHRNHRPVGGFDIPTHRLPGLAIVDDIDVLADVQRTASGGYITSETPEEDIYTETEVRLSVKKDEYP